MEIRQLNEDISVTGQISADDVAAISKAGFKSVICNRPDGETAGQPEQDGVAAAVKAAGLEYRFIPVVSGAITPENVKDMAVALEDMPRPVLAYCRSGGRCANLFTLVQENR